MRQKQGVFSLFLLSPSARRAWIEISELLRCAEYVVVALREEGVDRNLFGRFKQRRKEPSPSARRAWIEITGN